MTKMERKKRRTGRSLRHHAGVIGKQKTVNHCKVKAQKIYSVIILQHIFFSFLSIVKKGFKKKLENVKYTVCVNISSKKRN